MTVHKQLTDYYHNLCREHGGVPARSVVNPFDLKKILSWVLLLEWNGPRNLVPTLVGSAIDEAMGANFTGANMFDYYPTPVADAHEMFYKTILGHPCGGYLVRGVSKKNGAEGTLEALMFPLTDETGEINRLIGSMFFNNKQMASPSEPDKRTFTSMSIVELGFRDIGFGVPE